ncbi:uncharacterized protein TRIADDRAFT_50320 [Trichoplax adhaerens]|uniref:RING-type domain-containing protein n=1 Tax=Trichoplax adhaerens TaxID=10228 RepID=B3RYH4_TRIAD|nr:hypothetical protein TRIADDRAFT_50320 [Trichoplax adhaerens]EDV24597.1 hypothetical protein TRIADDRAFT_50320 [Trichoplax adhaerens]|eukprot:XP_002112487.1 hypothetical protein TRIADDRAFT_50320 [Trichoplax adhaerens]
MSRGFPNHERGAHGKQKHQGHEQMHAEMLLILFFALIVGQIVLVKWKEKHFTSFQAVTLIGMWTIPFYYSIVKLFWRMLIVWTVFTIISGYLLYRSIRGPIYGSIPRRIYSWFYFIYKVTYFLGIMGYLVVLGVFLGINVLVGIRPDIALSAGFLAIFYAMYYGVLARDIAEICANRLASKLGFYTGTGLPKRQLTDDLCAVCGQKLPESYVVVGNTSVNDDDEGDSSSITTPEKTYRLSCNHLFHEFCIRGWCIVGKKQTCPYCNEKVDLKRMFPNPWEKVHVAFAQLLDFVRYLIVWQPLIISVVQGVNYILGLK